MEAIRQIVRTPENHELKIKIPEHIRENELIEVILLVKEKEKTFADKIDELKGAMNDPVFVEDMNAVGRDFAHTDLEGWE